MKGKQETARRVLLAVAAVACLWGAGSRHKDLIEKRQRFRLDAAEPLANAPPLVVFTTVVLGGFRGLLADILWLRISFLQDEGRYFELVQLADWITKLEPRHSEIWAFHAWNLAYNVSVMTPDPADRWRWIRNGLDLLRKEGLRYNPADPMLYREIGWIYQNKIGGIADTQNLYYKRRLAEQITDLIGEGYPDYDALLADPETEERLAEEHGLVLEPMRRLDERYGPLDWRIPATHALYWASAGADRAGERGSLPCDRMIYQAAAAGFFQGRLTLSPEKGLYLQSPQLDLLPGCLAAYESALRNHGHATIAAAYAIFLKDAVYVLHTFNRDAEARRLFSRIETLFGPDETKDGFDAFVRQRTEALSLTYMPRRKAIAIVEGQYMRSLFWLARKDEDRAVVHETLARRLWDGYLQGKSLETRRRLGLPSFDDIRDLAFQRAMAELPDDLRSELIAPTIGPVEVPE
ncbi:MAG: hypothetical protein HQ559_14915 [Lentisphaerae bacterium]|nr:hypothetical protein [Lentisphaerota bacterium]